MCPIGAYNMRHKADPRWVQNPGGPKTIMGRTTVDGVWIVLVYGPVPVTASHRAKSECVAVEADFEAFPLRIRPKLGRNSDKLGTASGKASENIKGFAPTFLKAFQGPWGRPDFKNTPTKIRPECHQVFPDPKTCHNRTKNKIRLQPDDICSHFGSSLSPVVRGHLLSEVRGPRCPS